ncbi:MAG: DUF934 domain-containing protein [Betaproteobacteria bacterium]|jgi:uncharacterized protein (DUF934 family)|nr:DUF934 domain-containing protein [Betaproteobacteria bacterium]MCH9848287.1 DUF934 domain-containing protein [Betaproteobacteria bacterium]MDG1096776.1 DUF934 domain-containing protein [Methylophilaceae bacterium]MDG1454471.1 DUF934 domain-containing protein [Methylophilaceae bacterium]
MSQLIKGNQIAQNEWTRVIPPTFGDEPVRKQAGKVVMFKLHDEETFTQKQIDATEIPATGKILLPLTVWLAKKESLATRMAAGEIGIVLQTHEPIEKLVEAFDDLNSLPVIAVYVQIFADGRNFTLGNLLRTRYGFKNELRAVGDIMRDQLYFLKRSGFDSYLIKEGRNAEEAIASLNDFTQPYQGASDDVPVWRRVNRSQV